MSWTDDIYFNQNYGKLYESCELGTADCFDFKSPHGRVIHHFIKREIPLISGAKYYDIRTPYGYGGPLIVFCNDKEKLLYEYENHFKDYCHENRIATEFVRFHPIAGNALDFYKIYQPVQERKTVGTNLKICDDPFQSEFTKHCRKNIRQALHKGVSYQVVEKPEDLSVFQKIYFDTMDRNEAQSYYYFGMDYFNKLIKYFQQNLLLVCADYENSIIAAALCFVSNNIVHIHLSGTLKEYLHLSPAYILRYAVYKWSLEHDICMIHHGGGRTNAADDSLYLFKKQFGCHTLFDFYIAEKVWEEDVYHAVLELKQKDESVNDFIRRNMVYGKGTYYCRSRGKS